MAKREMSTQAKAAKMIRAHLKAQGIKARVTSSEASMTCSVNIEIENQLPAAVREIEAYCDQYSYERDRNRDLPQARFVFVRNEWTDEKRRECFDYLLANFPGELTGESYDARTLDDGTILHRALCDFDSSYGWTSTQKPRTSPEAI